MKITELLEDLEIQYKLHGEHRHVTEEWAGISCPRCQQGGEEKFKLGINLRTNATSCWSCGVWSLAEALEMLTGKGLKECYQLLGQVEKSKTSPQRKRTGGYKEPYGVETMMQIHLNYLYNRKFNALEVEKLWDVRGITIHHKLSWRIFIPVIYQSEPVSWTTRSISEKHKPRYISAPPTHEKYPLKSLLYGEDFVRHSILVTEGPLDVWAIGPGATCTFGVSYTKAQVARIAEYPQRVIVFDSDPIAQRRASKLASELEAMPGSTFRVQIESGADPASASKKEIRELRKRFLEGDT